ncbi:hypothetical protein [Stenotrophomonas sp. AS1]|uniref:hypothetical protein n=1 Tax=Stenotrophomonas sp. AS1 TaxID=3029188 RepID=UPI003BA03291
MLSIAFTVTIFMVGAALWFGRSIPFQQQWPLFEALRATAAIIFAVVGAWLAIVYPERLRLSFTGLSKPADPVNDKFTTLFTPIAHSTIILGLVLLAGIAAPIAKQVPLILEYKEWARTTSFVLLVVLTLWQVWTVVLTLYPADLIKSQADKDMSQAKMMEAIRGLGGVQAPDVANDQRGGES